MSDGTLYPTVVKVATTPGSAGVDVPMTEWGAAAGVDKVVAAIIVTAMATAGGNAGGTAPGTAELSLTCVTYSLGQVVGTWRGQLSSSVTGDSIVAVTGWVPALWADAVIVAWIVASAAATFRCRLVFRVAEVSREAPGAWQSIPSESDVSGNSERCDQRTLTLAGNMWVQFGVAYSSTTGGTMSNADLVVSVGVRRL